MSLDTDRVHARKLALAGDFGPSALALNLAIVAADPSDEDARTRLARCYRAANRLAEAEAEYREVLRLNPQNRIAAGAIESMRQGEAAAAPKPPSVPKVSGRAATAYRAPRTREHAPADRPTGPVPASFNGFRQADFDDLRRCAAGDVAWRFAPRVAELVKHINALPACPEWAALRDPGQKHLFRASRRDVHAKPRQWDITSLGGRFEPQFNVAMRAGGGTTGDWFRIGLGLDLSAGGRDAETGAGQELAREYLRRLQQVVDSDRRHLLTGWMARDGLLVQIDGIGPRRDLEEPSRAADEIGRCGDGTAWVFAGRWLFPDRPEDAATLADPVGLVRAIERAFAGALPLYRALMA